jgi:hypothetical protein
MTTKKKYKKPSMQVFELKQQPQLLAGSAVTQSGSIDDYEGGAFSWYEY